MLFEKSESYICFTHEKSPSKYSIFSLKFHLYYSIFQYLDTIPCSPTTKKGRISPSAPQGSCPYPFAVCTHGWAIAQIPGMILDALSQHSTKVFREVILYVKITTFNIFLPLCRSLLSFTMFYSGVSARNAGPPWVRVKWASLRSGAAAGIAAKT